MRDEIGEIPLMTELLESCLIVDESRDDLSILWDTRLLDEDEISVIDSFLIHRVSLCSEKKILLRERNQSSRYWDLGLDVLLGEYRHPASDRPDEWDHPDLVTIRAKVWRDTDLRETISIDPPLGDELIDEDGYRSR